MKKLATMPAPPAAGATIIEQVEAKRSAISVSEFAGILSFSRTVVYEWIDRGQLGSFNIDGSIRLDPKECVRFLRDRWIPAAESKKAA